SEVCCFFRRRITGTYNRHILTFKEKSIANSTSRYSEPVIFFFRRQSQPFCSSTGRNDDRFRRNPGRAINLHFVYAPIFRELHFCCITKSNLRAETLGLCL